jgi:NTE family protein
MEVTVKNARKALVLGGGGVTGIGWELGVLAGLAEQGVDLSDADVIVGTSAGAVVGAQLTSGNAVPELYAAQLAGATGEIAASFGKAQLLRMVLAGLLPGSEQQTRARLGKLALNARTVSEAERRAVIEKRLPVHDWPDRQLLIPVVDAETGEAVVLDRNSGVSLVDAVAASCAVPLVWPPVTINGRRYVDGGVRSGSNVDLAKDCGRVVVLAPIPRSLRRSGRISEQLAGLGPKVHSVVVSPSDDARKAMGRNALDPGFRAASAKAGKAQASSVRDRVAVVWGKPPS